MIDYQHGKIVFECDACSDVLETGEVDFVAANVARAEEGWKVRKRGDDWLHFCCQACADA